MNPIPKHNLWVTKTLAEIQEYIDQFPKNQRGDLHHIMMLTLNACHKLVEENKND
jgi:hypothetical protein